MQIGFELKIGFFFFFFFSVKLPALLPIVRCSEWKYILEHSMVVRHSTIKTVINLRVQTRVKKFIYLPLNSSTIIGTRGK